MLIDFHDIFKRRENEQPSVEDFSQFTANFAVAKKVI